MIQVSAFIHHPKTNIDMKHKKMYMIGTLAVLIASCCPGPFCPQCKITPPPTANEKGTEAAAKIEADVKQLQITGKVDTSWKKTIKDTYTTLNDENSTYFMLFQAIECASRQGDKELARQMLVILDREIAARRPDPALRSKSYTPSGEVEKARAKAVLATY